ncbi:DNA topoisomerase III [Curvibacter gracilis]|uniref:DNA topoisomerase III n=1 Tax=Curvibacter gracilis TaxID=230310 RepID=UPI0004895D0A|nr:DNA topoisomerase III [Curvibacter gracilis]
MRLFIAEKPSVAKAIAAELGNVTRAEGYLQCGADRVTWCFGHILEMAKPEHYGEQYAKWRAEALPIIPQAWALLPKDDAKAQLAVIGRLLKDATEVVNAGDPDREGQLLVDEVLDHFKNRRDVKRFWVSAQDSVSIQRGLAALKNNKDYQGLKDAALARQRADWLIGMNFSRAYTLRAQRGGAQKTVLTVGRVQTPTLALVVARDREIEAFKPAAYFTLQAQIEHANGAFRAAWKAKDDQAGLDSEGRLVDKAIAEAITKATTGQAGTLKEYRQEPKADGQPRAYALSDITLKASNKFGYSAEDVLKACQALYETHKLTSYPRTDCVYLPESQHADAGRVLAALKHVNPGFAKLIDGADPTIKSKTWNDAKITAHHGIIPTMHQGDASRLSDIERNIYELIVRAYLAQFYPAHEYMSTTIAVDVQGETFTASGKTVTRNGWRDVYQVEQEEGEAEEDTQALPPMQQGDGVKCARVDTKAMKTKPPARFTEGTLGKAMENVHKFVTDPEERKILKEGDGIGTSATRAAIISELKRRGFLEPKGKQIISTTLGRGLIDTLPEKVKSASLTAFYESMLKEIEGGKCAVDTFIEQQAEFIRGQVAEANSGASTVAGSTGPACPKCGEGHLRRIPRKDGKGHFWGCNRYSEGCSAVYDDKGGKPDTAAKAAYKCPTCKEGTLRQIAGGAKGKFWGCSRYRDGCRTTFDDKGGKPDIAGKKGA